MCGSPPDSLLCDTLVLLVGVHTKSGGTYTLLESMDKSSATSNRSSPVVLNCLHWHFEWEIEPWPEEKLEFFLAVLATGSCEPSSMDQSVSISESSEVGGFLRCFRAMDFAFESLSSRLTEI